MARQIFALNFVTLKKLPQIDVVEGPGRILSARRTGPGETATRNVTNTSTISGTETESATRTGTITQTTTGARVAVSVTHRVQLVPDSPPPVPVTVRSGTARSKDGRREAELTEVCEVDTGTVSAPRGMETSAPQIVTKGVPLGARSGKSIVDSDRDKDDDGDLDDDTDSDKDRDDDRGEDTDDEKGVRFPYADLAVEPPLAPRGTKGKLKP